MKLENKVAIVTGAAQGIGYGIAKIFLEEGAQVIVADLNEEIGKKAVDQLGTCCAKFIPCDVSKEDEVRSLIERTVEEIGKPDIVVNNAGICDVRMAEESSVEEWDRLMGINVRSIFLTTKFAVPFMREQGGGAILNVASISSFVGQKGTPAYTASKGAVLALTKSLAVDYGPANIRVNCICPGITDTPMLRYHMGQGGDPEGAIRERLKRVPLGRMLYPEDMGKAAAFLCSDDAAGITGASLVIDGGYIACAEFEGA
jgi:NAD(P)-dependent dehydrogenase (short-subunit alcohol dehydrogenase family)